MVWACARETTRRHVFIEEQLQVGIPWFHFVQMVSINISCISLDLLKLMHIPLVNYMIYGLMCFLINVVQVSR
jgi:hypothetical protein